MAMADNKSGDVRYDAPKLDAEDLARMKDAGESDPGMDSLVEEAVSQLSSSRTKVEVNGVMTPLNWRVLILPKKPPEKIGSIAIDDGTQEREEYLTHLGRVVAMGPLAFKSRTAGGLNLAEDAGVPKPGDWVLYGHTAGIRFRLMDSQIVVLLADTEILAVTQRPEDFMFYL